MGVWYGSAGPFSKGRRRGAAGGILSASWSPRVKLGECAPPTVVCTILLIGHCYHLGRCAPGEHGVHVPLQSPTVFFHICHGTQQSVDEINQLPPRHLVQVVKGGWQVVRHKLLWNYLSACVLEKLRFYNVMALPREQKMVYFRCINLYIE